MNAFEMNPSVSESRYEIVKKPSAPGRMKKKDEPLAVAIFHEKTHPSLPRITLKPLKPAKIMSPSVVDTDQMTRLYDKYLKTNNETVNDVSEEIVAPPPAPPQNSKPTKLSLILRPKSNTKSWMKKKECMNENILTEESPPPAGQVPKRGSLTRALKFFKKETKPHVAEEIIIVKNEESPNQLEKKDSTSSDPTVVSHDTNSILDTVPGHDEAATLDNTAMDISVFEVFEQYTGGAFPTHHCSPRLPKKQFEINKQAELLSRIEKLQKELSESKGTVQELQLELDEVYCEKDVAVHKLDRLIEFAKLQNSRSEEHEKLREIRMYLTDRTEPTISSITTTGSYHHPSGGYQPFCSCFRSRG
jgi:uncharacterized coiled-coil protein SlyX